MSGFEFKTIHDWFVEAENKYETFHGTTESFVYGNTFDVSIGTTNKIYAVEYGQIYPGLKWDVGMYSNKVMKEEKTMTMLKDQYYLRKLSAQKEAYETRENYITACQQETATRVQHIIYTENVVETNAVRDASAEYWRLDTEIQEIKAAMLQEQAEIVKKMSKSVLETVKSTVISGDVRVDGTNLQLLG